MKYLILLITVSGFITGSLVLLIGVLFKIMDYPDHNLMIYGGLFLIIASGLIKLNNKKE